MNRNPQRGIGLLELLLSLVVISTLVLLAVQLYPRLMQRHRLQAMVKQVQLAQAASARYRAQSAHGVGARLLSVAELVRMGWMPASMQMTPWGTTWQLQAGDGQDGVHVTITGLSAAACRHLGVMLQHQGVRQGQCLAGVFQGQWQVVL